MSEYVIRGAALLGEETVDIHVANGLVEAVGSDLQAPGAIEIDADVVLKATKVDGVYTADPFKDPHAEKFDHLTYDEVLDRKLGVMDLTAICLCRDHKMPLRVFNMNKPGALLNIVHGGAEGTLIEEGQQ